MIVLGVSAITLIALMSFGIGYAIGHYEALRCSCVPTSQHFIRRWIGLELTKREKNAITITGNGSLLS